MHKYILILLSMLLIGCTLSRSMEIRGSVSNAESVYGSGNANTEYKSNTTIGFLNDRD